MEKTNRSEPLTSQYLHAKGARLGLPIAGNFELTARCNFDCPMCYVHLKSEDMEAAGRELTAQQWIDLAREARDAGMVYALLTGGEPFLRKDFFEIYHAMKQMGLMVSINSNGSMIRGKILEQLLEDPPLRINVSLYGGCAETYRTMCGQDAFDTVVENLRTLKKAGVDVRLNVSITPYNYRDLSRIYAISRELDVHVKAASYMYPSIRVNGNQFGCCNRLTPEDAALAGVEWDKLRFSPEEFDQRARNLKARSCVEPPECAAELDTGIHCRAGSTTFWITWDGRTLPCGMMPKPEVHPLETGFSEAWQNLRSQVRQIRLPAACAVCPSKSICPVCAAVCITETGHFDQVPEYICRHTEATVEHMWNAYLERKQHEDQT